MASMREALEAAFDQSEATESQSPADTGALSDAADPTTDAATSPPEPVETAAETQTEGERQRDSLGRFTRAEQADGKGQLPPGAQNAPAPVLGAPAAIPERAPANVPPMLREQWQGLPQEFRDYTLKRENEVQLALQASHKARDFVENFFRSIQPYQQAIQIEAGGDPMRATLALMDTASRLRFGTQNEKAQLLAKLINDYQVDVQTLDAALVNAPMPQQGFDPGLIRREVQNALSPLMQRAEQRRQEQAAALDREVEAEISKFASDPKHEFYDDVRGVMADVFDIAERNGQKLSLEEAYDRACLLHPEVNKVIVARQGAKAAQDLTRAAQRSKAAAVSVTGAAPVGNPESPKPGSVREAIEAAIEVHSRV